MDPGRIPEKNAPDATDLCDIMRIGTVARSPMRNWIYMKMPMRIPPRIKRTMMRALSHEYVVPPHCRARSRQTIPGRKTIVPRGSSFIICSFRVSVFLLGGVDRMNRRTTKTTPPMGRLM